MRTDVDMDHGEGPLADRPSEPNSLRGRLEYRNRPRHEAANQFWNPREAVADKCLNPGLQGRNRNVLPGRDFDLNHCVTGATIRLTIKQWALSISGIDAIIASAMSRARTL